MRWIVVTLLIVVIAPAWGEESKTLPSKKKIERQLDISPRLQWTERAGYCGECSIQQAGLYYGNYVSQFVCRKIIDPEQKQDVLVRINADRVLKALNLEFDEFDTTNTPTPQYQPYLLWVKQHLHDEHPVIITLYDQEDEFPDYDHIVLATGFRANDVKAYHPEDTLIFYDHFKLEPHRREFKTLHDTREMKGNGKDFYYCIPAEKNYGCAITGIKDETKALRRVQVTADKEEEPDVVKEVAPVELNLTVTISGLKAGKSYVLYRYNDHEKVPTKNYAKSKYLSARKFVATGAEQEFQDKCLSHGVSMYRCLPEEGK